MQARFRLDEPCPTVDTVEFYGCSGWEIVDDGAAWPATESEVTEKPPYRVPSMADVAAVRGSAGLSLVSTFSGCGGSCLGFELAGFRVLWASEFVDAAREVYEANHPGVPVDARDIRDVEVDEILAATGLRAGELDVLEGSPPCASFSLAGDLSKGWGEVRKYSDRHQRVDDLFAEFTRRLPPALRRGRSGRPGDRRARRPRGDRDRRPVVAPGPRRAVGPLPEPRPATSGRAIADRHPGGRRPRDGRRHPPGGAAEVHDRRAPEDLRLPRRLRPHRQLLAAMGEARSSGSSGHDGARRQDGARGPRAVPAEDDDRLERIRWRIDAIDAELLALLDRRLEASLEAIELKRRLGLPAHDQEREEAIVRAAMAWSRRPETARILAGIVEACRKAGAP